MTESAAATPPEPAGRSVVFSSTAGMAPMFLALRISLHTLVAALVAFVIVRAVLLAPAGAGLIVALALVLQATYVSGTLLLRSGPPRAAQLAWLAVVTAEVLMLELLTPDAAFLVFPLFFLQLHLLRARWAVLAVVTTTGLTLVILAMHTGWHVGGVLGPALGATVAVVIGMGYRALYRETQERQRLIDDLIATRQELASRERETGMLEERERLAREIHDTLAQGLSSIQLLLHAAERDLPQSLEHIRLARETAAANLAEARRFIRRLSPPALEEQTLPGALARLAETSTTGTLTVSFHLSGDPYELTMSMETALLRIAQASLANVAQHAGATRAELTLTYLDDWVGLDVVDDGSGFDPAAVSSGSSFGLAGLRSRVAGLGGTLGIESRPGAGTAIAASFDLERGRR